MFCGKLLSRTNIGESFMQEISKFQMVTIVIIALFIFAIGAIYSNTKDAVESKVGERAIDTKIEQSGHLKAQNRIVNQDKIELQAINDRIDALEQKQQQLVSAQENLSNKNSADSDLRLKCKVQGVIADGNIIYMSEDEAMQEAKVNNRDVVMYCSY